MERQEKVVLTLDSYEHGIMIRALNELRNDLLEEPVSYTHLDVYKRQPALAAARPGQPGDDGLSQRPGH